MEDQKDQPSLNRNSLRMIEDLDLDLDLELLDPEDEVAIGQLLYEFESQVEDIITWLKADRMCTGPCPAIGKKTIWS